MVRDESTVFGFCDSIQFESFMAEYYIIAKSQIEYGIAVWQSVPSERDHAYLLLMYGAQNVCKGTKTDPHYLILSHCHWIHIGILHTKATKK